MTNRKQSQQFYLSVEGKNTEVLYFEHIRDLINADKNSKFNLKLKIKVSKDPMSLIKDVRVFTETNVFHILDCESNSDEHRLVFESTIKAIRDIENSSNLCYEIGYSNISFDLWIVLHKTQLLKPISKAKDYLEFINKAYETKFESMDEYKKEDVFKGKILAQITLDDVNRAIKFAEAIRKHNQTNMKKELEKHGFKYYADNPDLTVHKCVEKMLLACGCD